MAGFFGHAETDALPETNIAMWNIHHFDGIYQERWRFSWAMLGPWLVHIFLDEILPSFNGDYDKLYIYIYSIFYGSLLTHQYNGISQRF